MFVLYQVVGFMCLQMCKNVLSPKMPQTAKKAQQKRLKKSKYHCFLFYLTITPNKIIPELMIALELIMYGLTFLSFLDIAILCL